MTAVTRLVSPGPVADAFTRSAAFIAGIVGPVGSGKTMAMLSKGVRNGALQGGKVDAAGVTRRRARFGVIRESYPNLEANTLKSWFNIVPEHYGTFSWKAPYVHSFQRVLRREGNRRDGRPVDVLEMEVEFRAIGDKSVEEVTRGWEVNCVGVDEADLQPAELIAFLSGRVGRFSNLDASLVREPQILLSLNMPYVDNWAYRLLLERELGELDPARDPDLAAALEGRPLLEAFVQPGGRAPDAENLHNLRGGRGYYAIQVAVNRHRPGYVDRMVDNKPVPLQHGQPVNPGFHYADHVRDDLAFDPARTLTIGVDQGLFAAAVFTQRTAMGQLRTLAEAVLIREDGKTLRKIGPTAFGRQVRAVLAQHFPDADPALIRVVADPAAFASEEREDRELDWILPFQAALGLRVRRARTNSAALRNEAIHRAQSERDGYLIHRRCKQLIRAHLGGYHYRKAETGDGETRGHLEIADTIYTHVADAEQYAALEGEGVVGALRGRAKRRAPVTVDSHYDELGRQ
ncbi:hypothetical protein [Sphingomonas sp. BK235]|uniref:hypothetical protein n=1 Tax=Sphingomonas sp. BK235 TaxID=2512131 RepID=UPI0010508D53|nr:hypothetical protein [Sphingomonas sp. BK235]TCP35904.1 hypothetical protein EV292_102494 [Sphingomonas sp. BK235]